MRTKRPFVIFERGQIIVAPFKFSDLDIYKVRPLLVVSHPDFCIATENLVAAMITTAGRSSWPLDIRIDEWESVGLTFPCFVRMKLFTIATIAVRDVLGRTTASTIESVEQSLMALLFSGARA